MISDKQLITNQKNAQASTGPTTVEGKAISASNAIKHGIFTQALVISSGTGQENQPEYEELLGNLISCLIPTNQMESLLVEKIAIDFWRLRRTIRFETSSIGKQIEALLQVHYSSYGNRNGVTVDQELQDVKEQIDWNKTYLKCLERNAVTFDSPIWEEKGIESDICEDLFLVANRLPNLSREERATLDKGDYCFLDLTLLLKRHGCATVSEISRKLIEIYSEENQELEEKIEELKNKKTLNFTAENTIAMMGIIPAEDNLDKILKYERSIQKSIFQNLFLLALLRK